MKNCENLMVILTGVIKSPILSGMAMNKSKRLQVTYAPAITM